MTKRGITRCLLSIALTIYLIVSLAFVRTIAKAAPCTGVDINIAQNEMTRFVTADIINAELQGIKGKSDSLKASEFDLRGIENALSNLDNIESVNCYRRADDAICIDIVPMIPVARVFSDTISYYLNAEGKRLTANNTYRIDVPVIIGNFDRHPEEIAGVLELLNEINSNENYRALVSAIEVNDARDILLVPSFTGHLINFGQPGGTDEKFKRLSNFYRQVLPVKGWNYYDTISVKFSGQVIGHVAPGNRRAAYNEFKDEDFDEEISIDAMTAETITPDEIKTRL